ncbi:MAG: hypothetical protein ACM3KR_00405 [Deltaproteobacteria bacterium]
MKDAFSKLVIILIGLLFIFAGVKDPLLGIIGKSTTGVVTETKKHVESSKKKNNNNLTNKNYDVKYSFSTPDGKSHSGSYLKTEVYNAASLPNKNSLIYIRYLQALPNINTASDNTSPSLATLGYLALGVVIIVFGSMVVKKKKEN